MSKQIDDILNDIPHAKDKVSEIRKNKDQIIQPIILDYLNQLKCLLNSNFKYFDFKIVINRQQGSDFESEACKKFLEIARKKGYVEVADTNHNQLHRIVLTPLSQEPILRSESNKNKWPMVDNKPTL